MSTRPLVAVREPVSFLGELVARAMQAEGLATVLSPRLIESSRYVHDEADLLDESELETATSALLEDGIFPDLSWLEEAGAERDAWLRAAIKYGWALAHAAQEIDAPAVWSVSQGRAPTGRLEFQFVVRELHRRGISATHCSPCWPISLEPAQELDGEQLATFENCLAEFATALPRESCGLYLRQALGKESAFQSIAQKFGGRAMLDLGGLGSMETFRVLSRCAPATFRAKLTAAQESFAFDKVPYELSTSEDDVHALPDVADEELERVFLDDFRGRQLLFVTAGSILQPEDFSAHREAIGAAVTRRVAQVAQALR